MNAKKRNMSPFSSVASAVKNTTNQMKEQTNQAKPVKNAIGMKPTGAGYSKIRGAVTGG